MSVGRSAAVAVVVTGASVRVVTVVGMLVRARRVVRLPVSSRSCKAPLSRLEEYPFREFLSS